MLEEICKWKEFSKEKPCDKCVILAHGSLGLLLVLYEPDLARFDAASLLYGRMLIKPDDILFWHCIPKWKG